MRLGFLLSLLGALIPATAWAAGGEAVASFTGWPLTATWLLFLGSGIYLLLNLGFRGMKATEGTFPVIVPMLLFFLSLFSLAHSGHLGNIGEGYAHTVHDKQVHYWLMLLGLWVFFLRLGAEIEISKVIAAGPLVIGATLGGVLVPMGLTTSLTCLVGGLGLSMALYASAGAMATDVPMALGSARAVRAVSAIVMLGALKMLAVGDDVLAVTAMTGMFAESTTQFDALAWECVILLGCWMVGKRGDIQINRMNGDKAELVGIFDFTFKAPAFWLSVAILNTYFLGRNGIEPILGGCLPLIFAPESVKHKVEEWTELPALWLLALFAVVAGAVDILQPSSWGIFTTLAVIGGFGGKIFGIYFGGLIGRNYSTGDYSLENFSRTSLLGMAVAGACNGTVAIIFVSVAESKGLIPHDVAGQMKIGFLLTVPISYIVNIIIGMVAKTDPSHDEASGDTKAA